MLSQNCFSKYFHSFSVLCFPEQAVSQRSMKRVILKMILLENVNEVSVN